MDSNKSSNAETGDEVSGVIVLTAADVLAGTKKVILLTEKGLSLGYPVRVREQTDLVRIFHFQNMGIFLLQCRSAGSSDWKS